MASNMKAVTRLILVALVQSAFLLAADSVDSSAAPAAALSAEPPVVEPSAADAATATAGTDDQWHLSVSPYLWLPGIHGDVGALGRDVGFRVSPATRDRGTQTDATGC